MSISSFKFRNTYINLDVDNAERVGKLSEKFNQRVEAIAVNNSATDLKLAYVAALMIEDELDKLQGEFVKKQNTKSSNEAAVGIISDTLNQVAQYIEQLAERIEKR
jgi:cell division protein ZapA (FtsZ GTPase activity inhibitor)